MRNGQNKRMRGRNNHRKSHNPMVRVYKSNGPDVKIRGNPSHIAEKYMQLARDAQTSGDPIAAENYYQHAEHYFRVIAAAQEQFRQNNPHFSRPENESPAGARDDGFDDDDDGPALGRRSRRLDLWHARAAALHPARRATFPAAQQPQQHRAQQGNAPTEGNVDRLPSFITGGQQPQHQSHQGQGPQQGQNGHDNQPDRFPLHRRRRRHRGPRPDMQGGGDGGDEPAPRGE